MQEPNNMYSFLIEANVMPGWTIQSKYMTEEVSISQGNVTHIILQVCLSLV